MTIDYEDDGGKFPWVSLWSIMLKLVLQEVLCDNSILGVLDCSLDMIWYVMICEVMDWDETSTLQGILGVVHVGPSNMLKELESCLKGSRMIRLVENRFSD